jgi:hypothetical protein
MKKTIRQHLAKERYLRNLYRHRAEDAERQVENVHAAWVRADNKVVRLEAALRCTLTRARHAREEGEQV